MCTTILAIQAPVCIIPKKTGGRYETALTKNLLFGKRGPSCQNNQCKPVTLYARLR